MPDHVEFNYNKITPYIFLGTNQCCQTHFDEQLLEKGVKVDISMEEERIDRPYGVGGFLWLPTKNHDAPSLKQLELGVAAIDKLVEQETKMYIHCKNGHGRAPTMLAAYFVSQGMSTEEAIGIIADKRPEIHIEDIQVEQLKKFQESIKQK